VANIKSQIKRNKTNERRRLQNQAVRSEVKTRVRTAREAVDSGAADAAEAVRLAQKRLAKAGSNGRIHRNQVARRTSRLMRRAARGAA
jgi:small subunit ribosomal protein S20